MSTPGKALRTKTTEWAAVVLLALVGTAVRGVWLSAGRSVAHSGLSLVLKGLFAGASALGYWHFAAWRRQAPVGIGLERCSRGAFPLGQPGLG